jgi:hypothetical protein
MKIFNPDTETQTFSIIGREAVNTVNVSIYIKDTRETETFSNIEVTNEVGYMTIQVPFETANNKDFSIEVTDTDGELIWRGLAFSTDQPTQNYKIYTI